MTKEALYLLLISSALFSFFLISIIVIWFFRYFRESKNNKLKQQLEDVFASYFDAGNENKRTIIQRLNKIVGKSARRKELFINIVISYDDDFIEANHDKMMNIYELTGVKAFLLKRLQSNSVHIQSLACRHLGELQLRDTKTSIIALISSKNNDVIYNVMLALAKLGDLEGLVHILTNESKNMNLSHRAIIEIISAFNGSKEELFSQTIALSDDYMKGILIKAMAPYRIEGLNEYYIKYLNRDDKNLKIASIRALCELNKEEHEPYILAKLDDHDWEVRAAAAKGLEKIGTHRSLAELGKTTGDSMWWVRHNAASALILIPGGIEFASNIINGDDKFARDAVASVIEMTS
ncbi:HEAT repeat domain-containing protein [Bacillus sp. FJAT-28004]|uniref:HEAT repeat domain-containing protein n=1 Tax=Bacillus sp. FJAT-28004 TaxID=1679165 RepID=UPI0006B4739E|nr:HEAT repeat domain-containing protein [Bacillus sp. FJAT-28004]